jgi:thiopeptide-type bacteriocin biosynthesis protein
MPWFEEGAVEQIAYEPEITRYGGPAALPHQERLFELSSRLAAKVIMATQGAWPRRANLAIQMMIAAALSVTDSADAAGQFFLGYANYWKSFARGDYAQPLLLDYESINRDIRALGSRHLPQIWLAALERANAALLGLRADGRLISPQTADAIKNAEEAQGTLRSIVASQIHMLNNRLGIGPEREHAIALALSKGAFVSARRNLPPT